MEHQSAPVDERGCRRDIRPSGWTADLGKRHASPGRFSRRNEFSSFGADPSRERRGRSFTGANVRFEIWFWRVRRRPRSQRAGQELPASFYLMTSMAGAPATLAPPRVKHFEPSPWEVPAARGPRRATAPLREPGLLILRGLRCAPAPQDDGLAAKQSNADLSSWVASRVRSVPRACSGRCPLQSRCREERDDVAEQCIQQWLSPAEPVR